jgi:GSH-dependent disulfide-bond oxidoreductase
MWAMAGIPRPAFRKRARSTLEFLREPTFSRTDRVACMPATRKVDQRSSCNVGEMIRYHLGSFGQANQKRSVKLQTGGTSYMIDVHYWTTPNGHKVTIFLEEAGLPYKIFPVNIGKGEQFQRAFLEISPNNRIPAIVDHDPPGGGAPISVFESGAILLYLAEKTGKFMAKDLRTRVQTLEWVFWQMGNLGPMSGQNNHFSNYAVEKLSYAMDRYRNEVNRLYGVLDRRLAERPYLAGDYSIADMASYPWVVPHERQGQKIADFPHLKRWLEAIAARPAVVRAYALVKDINPGQGGIRTAEERAILFGQTAASVRAAAR